MIITEIKKTLILHEECGFNEVHIVESEGYYYVVSNLHPRIINGNYVRRQVKFEAEEHYEEFLVKLQQKHQKKGGFPGNVWKGKLNEPVGPQVILDKIKELTASEHLFVTRESDPIGFTLINNECVFMMWSGDTWQQPIDDRTSFEAQLFTEQQKNVYLDNINNCTRFYKYGLLPIFLAKDADGKVLFYIINRPRKNLVKKFKGF